MEKLVVSNQSLVKVFLKNDPNKVQFVSTLKSQKGGGMGGGALGWTLGWYALPSNSFQNSVQFLAKVKLMSVSGL